ncbi:hypothetical protein JTE90_008153 [Oedothorax gibbosus]|uniref:Uncharacterized protein n=1 Tax=Oedothorax gibbosus TaxID=931172 RepID=A0AAV6VGB3_9ARAC|nr:hypothetical protein JTE90_008153 [Oedothorax gibbosus]
MATGRVPQNGLVTRHDTWRVTGAFAPLVDGRRKRYQRSLAHVTSHNIPPTALPCLVGSFHRDQDLMEEVPQFSPLSIPSLPPPLPSPI